MLMHARPVSAGQNSIPTGLPLALTNAHCGGSGDGCWTKTFKTTLSIWPVSRASSGELNRFNDDIQVAYFQSFTVTFYHRILGF